MFEPDAPLFRPGAQAIANVLRPVVAANDLRRAPPFDDLLQGADHPLRRQQQIDLDTQAFPVEVVDHVEQPIGASIAECSMHEVH